MKEHRNKKRDWLRRLIVVELIVCYMAVLTLVSHVRGPEKYRVDTETSLLTRKDFVSFSGEEAGNTFRFDNDASGTAVGYSAELSLQDLKGIHVSFQLDCPVEYVGGTLYVDLYNFETGYDNAEQEFALSLEPGVNTVGFTLDPGESAPDHVQLRFFTLDPAGYDIKELAVSRVETLPKVSMGMAIVTAACFVLLGSTAVMWRSGWSSGKRM